MKFNMDMIITLIACLLVLLVLFIYNKITIKKYNQEKEKNENVKLENMLNTNYMSLGMMGGLVVGVAASFFIDILSFSSCMIIGLLIGMCVGMFVKKK